MRSHRECISGVASRLRKQFATFSDNRLLSNKRLNDSASAARKRKGVEFPRHRVRRRLLIQEMHKRGLGT